ncbi:MAG TPA: restriction endonuclease subunit S, partial [Desulfobacterales bacterium]|nr:restriction endonuclease subunit S [Desulfobacterales bacterium]
MHKWTLHKLGDVITSNNQSIGKEYPHQKILYLDTGSITRGEIDSFQEFSLKDAPSRAKRLVKNNNIIYSTVRPIQRHYGFIVNPLPNFVVSTGFSVIETNQELAKPLYIYYFLTSDEIVETLDIIADGSTSAYPSLKPSDIEKLEILLPPLPEQKEIASVLSSLDDKIGLLHRQNKTLEAMAETLFRQWFVEEAQEDWDEKPLGDIATVQNGYAFSSRDYVANQIGHLEVFKMGHIEPGGGLRYSPKSDFVPRTEKLKQWILSEGDIVMAMTDMKDSMGILGHPAMIDKSDTYVLNQRVARIYLNGDESLINNHFLYLQLKTDIAIAVIQSK